MCDPAEPVMTREPLQSGLCVKCKRSPPHILTRQGVCRECFKELYTHRFRSTLGKGKAIQYGDRILIAYSGGPSSSSMLHIVRELLRDETFFKRLNLSLVVGHISEETLLGPRGALEAVRELAAPAAAEGLPFDHVALEDVFALDPPHVVLRGVETHEYDVVRAKEEEKGERGHEALLLATFEGIKTVTAKEDLLKHLRNRLLHHLARRNGCNKIFVGHNGTRLAVEVLSMTAQGRGFSLPLEAALVGRSGGGDYTLKEKERERREKDGDEGKGKGKGGREEGGGHEWQDIPLVRPMKELLSKEVSFYNHLLHIPSLPLPSFSSLSPSPKLSIEYLTEAFVSGLQKDFPSTVGAITKTAEKFSFQGSLHPSLICSLCQSPRSADADQWKKSIMYTPEEEGEEGEEGEGEGLYEVSRHVCYGCQVNLRDHSSLLLPPYVARSMMEKQV